MGGYTDQVGADILRGIGAPVTAANLRRLRAWARAEGGSASFNPFNTTMGESGATNYNKVGVKNYPTQPVGTQATVATLRLGYYKQVVAALRDTNTTDAQFAAAVGSSPWGTSGKLIAKILNAPGPVSISTATPSASAGTPQSSSGSTQAVTCYWHIPFPGASGDICLDNVLWIGMITGGGLIFLVGAAILAINVGAKNPAIRKTAETAMIAFPAGKIATSVKTATAARSAAGRQEAQTEHAFKREGYDRKRTSTTRSPAMKERERAVNSTSGARRKPVPPKPKVTTTRRVATRAEAGF
jgi:hypothetical protein